MASEPQWQAQGEPISYSIIMQPSSQPWLFSLDVGRSEQERHSFDE